MNVKEANKLIHGLNLVAEAATTIAAAVEELAWDGIEDHAGMPGIRPIAAAMCEAPAWAGGLPLDADGYRCD